MRQIEIARHRRRYRRRVDLMVCQGLEAVDLKPEGRRRHTPLADDHRRHGSDLNPNLRVFVQALERRQLAGRRHSQGNARAIIGF